MRGKRQYIHRLLLGLATGAYKEHISILPLAAPCRFPWEQPLSRYPGISEKKNIELNIAKKLPGIHGDIHVRPSPNTREGVVLLFR